MAEKREVVVLSAVRSPIGAFGGSLAGIEPAEPGLSPTDRLKLAQLRKLETDEAIRNGFLLDKVTLRPLLTESLLHLNRDISRSIRQILADHGTPEPTIRSVMSGVEESQRRCVARVQAMLKDAPADADAETARLL